MTDSRQVFRERLFEDCIRAGSKHVEKTGMGWANVPNGGAFNRHENNLPSDVERYNILLSSTKFNNTENADCATLDVA